MEPTPHPLTLTVEQAAKILGIGRSTAYELVHTGAIPQPPPRQEDCRPNGTAG